MRDTGDSRGPGRVGEVVGLVYQSVHGLVSASCMAALTDGGRRCNRNSRRRSTYHVALVAESWPGSLARACMPVQAAWAVLLWHESLSTSADGDSNLPQEVASEVLIIDMCVFNIRGEISFRMAWSTESVLVRLSVTFQRRNWNTTRWNHKRGSRLEKGDSYNYELQLILCNITQLISSSLLRKGITSCKYEKNTGSCKLRVLYRLQKMDLYFIGMSALGNGCGSGRRGENGAKKRLCVSPVSSRARWVLQYNPAC